MCGRADRARAGGPRAALEQFLDRLLPPVARRCGGRGKLAAAALDALRRVEESCPGAGAKIRRKVPAYR